MIYVLWALGVLSAGVLAPLVLARWRAYALACGVGALLLGGLLCLAGAASGLGGAPPGIETLRWPLPYGAARLELDGLSAWFLLTIGVLAVAVAPYSWSYFRAAAEREHGGVSIAFLCVLTGAMVLLVVAADAALFLLSWELVSLAAFVLVLVHHREPGAARAAWMYLMATHLGTALCLLPLFGFLVAKSGTTDLQAFRAALQSIGPGVATVLFVLGLIGFGTKAGFMPMHVWLPVAHPAAPSPASALLSGVVIKTGIYGLLRLLGWLPNLPTSCAVIMLVFGMTSGVVGVLYALAQHDIKRLLAYHSVENIGIIGLGIGMGMLGRATGQPAVTALGYAGALLHVLNHALFKGLLFLSAGAVIHGTGTGDLERLGGLARKTPVNAALFLIAALAICALPPLNGFVSEWLVYGALLGGVYKTSGVAAGSAVLGTVSLALLGGLALACFAKAFGVIFLGAPRDATIRAPATPSPMRLGMVILAAGCLAIGLLPGCFVPLTTTGVSAICRLESAEIVQAMSDVLAPAGRLSLAAGVLIGLAAALAFGRRALLRRNTPAPVADVQTWGCGYAAPTARMQYTASSFAWPLIQSFRHVLWPNRAGRAPTDIFPGRTQLETHTPDLAENDFFAPLFRGLARVFLMIRTVSWSGAPAPDRPAIWPTRRINPLRLMLEHATHGLRRGSIHVYLMFIVIALLAVLLVEVFASPTSFDASAVPSLQGGAP